MSEPNSILLNADGMGVVTGDGHPQMTDGEGASCCCGCPEPFPSNYHDEFSGLQQAGNLFLTDETQTPSPSSLAHPVGDPYSLEQLAHADGRFQLVAFDDEPNVNGTRNMLMNTGYANFYYPPRWKFSNIPDHKNPKVVAPSQFVSSSHRSIVTKADIYFGDSMTSHQQTVTNPITGAEEQMASGYPFIYGLLAMQSLAQDYTTTGGGNSWREVQTQVGVYVWNPAERTDLGQTWPLVEWNENHLKRVDFDTYSNGTLSKSLMLPIESGDSFEIAAQFIKYENTQRFGRDIGQWTFCVSFRIQGVEVHRQPHVVFGYQEGRTFPPSQMFCDFLTSPYIQTQSERAYRYGDFATGIFFTLSELSPMVCGWDNLSVICSGDDLDFNCDEPDSPDPVVMLNFANATGRTIDPPPTTTPPTLVLTYADDWSAITTSAAINYAATLTGATAPNVFTIATGSLAAGLSLNSSTGAVSGTATTASTGSVSILVTDTNGDADVSPVYSWTVTAPAVLVLTYPYNWANISTIMATSFAAVLTGATSPLTYNIETGSLPSGLSLNTTTGLVSGTPSGSGSGSVSIKVVDTNSATDTSPVYTWNVTGMGGGGGP